MSHKNLNAAAGKPKRVAIVISNPGVSITTGWPVGFEDELKALGANFIQAGLWKGLAIRDGNLVTGQQNSSGGETA
jgi:hypothetical protein